MKFDKKQNNDSGSLAGSRNMIIKQLDTSSMVILADTLKGKIL